LDWRPVILSEVRDFSKYVPKRRRDSILNYATNAYFQILSYSPFNRPNIKCCIVSVIDNIVQ